MSDDDEMVLWGTIHGWSKKLGIAEDVVRDRCKELRSQPTKDPTVKAYAEPEVLEACVDLLRPQMVDTNVECKDIRKEMKEEHEGPCRPAFGDRSSFSRACFGFIDVSSTDAPNRAPEASACRTDAGYNIGLRASVAGR